MRPFLKDGNAKIISYLEATKSRKMREADCAPIVLAECKFRQEVPK